MIDWVIEMTLFETHPLHPGKEEPVDSTGFALTEIIWIMKKTWRASVISQK